MYTIYTCDLPQSEHVTLATFADDTAVLACSNCPNEASDFLQTGLQEIETWLSKWRIKTSVTKSVHVTFTLRRGDCPPVTLCNQQLPQEHCVKYLGIHLDRRLVWKQHIQKKREEINLKYRGLYWLLGRNSKLSVDNKLLIYEMLLKPIWTYGIQLWGSACDSNINIIQRVQNYILKQISNCPWFIKTSEIHEHLKIRTVKQEIKTWSMKYRKRLEMHPNKLATQLTTPDLINRLKRRQILSLDRHG